jgi:hypothetical protein
VRPRRAEPGSGYVGVGEVIGSAQRFDEINLTTYNLCRINMFLHDVNFEHFDIAHGDTLIDPAHWDDEPCGGLREAA